MKAYIKPTIRVMAMGQEAFCATSAGNEVTNDPASESEPVLSKEKFDFNFLGGDE